MSTRIFHNGLLDYGPPMSDYMGTLSEDRPPYKRIGQPDENSLLDRMSRALQVHREWIWNDGLRILKLAHRVENLEIEMAELKGTLERVLTKNMN